ncbi:MAG: SurA N-terminal domain-containing protein, partial [bacterium]
MHYRFLTIIVFISLILPSQVLSNQERTTPVAFVNGTPIQKHDLFYAMEAEKARSGTITIGSAQGKIKVSIRRASRQTLDRLINIELLYQEGLKHKFTGLSEETEKRYQKEVLKAGGEERLAAALACNKTAKEHLKRSILRNLVINRYLEKEVYSRIPVTDMEIREYYKRNLSR